jgi:hypothetical protein
MTAFLRRGPWLAKWRIIFAGLVALIFLAQGGTAAAANKRLRDFTPSEVSRLAPLGRLASTQQLNLAIGLSVRNQAALTEFLKELSDPASPNYRHYLTPAQFTEQFGPTEADYAAVVAFAKAKGLTVTSTHANRMIVDVQGRASTVETAFNVRMMSYQHPTEARKFYAPDAPPTVEGNLPILDINGLNNYSLPQPHYKLLKKNLQPAAKANAGVVTGQGYGTAPTPNVGSGPSGTYMGGDFRNAYVPNASQKGTGQTVGLLQFDGYTTSDITYYESLAGLPNVPLTNVLLDGFTGTPTGNGGEVEVSLDIEMAMSMAPSLSGIIVYEAGPSGNWHDILNRMATDNLASQLSCSWYIPSGVSDPTADQIFQEMAAQGQSFFSASGDSDAFTGLIPFPGDSPYITIVGGTMLTMNGTGSSYASEAAWNRGNNIGTGGGISTQYSIPTWQQGISMTSNLGSTTMRNVPDVALTAEAVYVRADGIDEEVGGTSCASPLWAGFMALVNQQATSNSGKSVGFINPAVYAIGSGAGYTTDFHDTTTGNNFSTSSPAKFPAVTGYDLATGWGSPTGSAMITALAGSSTPTISTTSPLASAVVGSNYSQTFAASGGTSPYTWSITGTSTPPGLTMSTSGVLSGLPPSSGTVTFTVQVTDLNSHSSSSAFSLTIYPQGTPVIATTSPLPAGNATVAYTDTLTATGGTPPLSWSLASGSLPDGLSLSTSGVISGTPTTTGGSSFTVQVTDSNGLNSTAPLSLTINAAPQPPTISTLSPLPVAKMGTAYTETLTATGGTTPYAWSLASGALPSGMIMSSSGVITGTATLPNTYSFSVRVTGGNGLSSITLFFLTVTPLGTLIPNGSFELGSFADWVTSDLSGDLVSQRVTTNGFTSGYGIFSTAATDGLYSAVNGFDSTIPGTIRVAQDIVITGTNTLLTFDYRAGWDMKDYTGSTQPRTFAVTIEPAGGGATEATFLQLTAAPGTVTLDTGTQSGTVNLSAYVGTPIRICFDCTIPESHTGPGLFELDNVRLGSTATPIITTSSPLPNGAVHSIYSQTLAAIGGTAPYTWHPVAGILPTGLSLSTTGTISGIAGAQGNYAFEVVAISATGASATKAFGVTINAAGVPPTITTPSTLPAGTVGVAYSQALAATGGVTPYTWSILSGSLPSGLTLSSSGVISGTPTSVGDPSFLVQVAGADGGSSIASFSLATVGGALNHFAWSTISSPQSVGTPFPATITAQDAGNNTVTSFTGTVSLTAGGTQNLLNSPVPTGSFNNNTWTIGYSFTPSTNLLVTGVRSYSGTKVSIWTDTGTLVTSAAVTAAAGAWSDTPLATPVTLQAGTTYRVGFLSGGQLYYWRTDMTSIFANGTIVQDYESLGDTFPTTADSQRWIFVDLDYVVGSSASVPITPSATGNFAAGVWTGNITAGQPATGIAIQANDGAGHSGASNVFNVTATADLSVSPSTGLAASGPVGGPFSSTGTYTLSNLGTGTMTWSAGVGQPWMSLTASTGTLGPGGTTQVTASVNANANALGLGAYTDTLTFTNTVNGFGNTSLPITLNVLPPAPVVMSSLTASGAVGQAFGYQITGSNNPTSYSASGLPAGLSVNTSNGAITGNPTVGGLTNVTIGATNAGGTGTATLVITILQAPTITNGPPPAALSNSAYSFAFAALGYPVPTYALTAGSLPNGLTLSPAGVISGTTTATGNYPATVTATNSSGTSTQSFTLVVQQAPVITNGPPPGAPQSAPYSFIYTFQGYPTPTFSVTSGSLPPGLTLSSAGAITGSPTTQGTYTGVTTASNGVSPAATQSFSIAIAPLSPPAPTPEPPTTLGSSNTVTWASVNGAVQYEVEASTDPNFTTVIDSGWITGTTYTFTNLTFGTTYYFRVSARSSSTPDGAWSQTTETAFNPDTLSNVVAETGNLFIADSNNDTIRQLTTANNVTTFAGTAGQTGSLDAKGTAARFDYTSGGAFDAAGNLYIADAANNTIRKIAPDGTTSTFAGLAGSSGSVDGKGGVARFNTPYGLAFDSSGNLFVADRNNYTIRKITPDGTVSTFAGLAGVTGSTDGAGSSARFNWPAFPAVDRSNNVYIADQSNSTIRKITPTGTVTTLAGSPGQFASTDGTGSAARFNNPSSVAVDATGNVYVTDNGNSTIRKITPTGTVTTFAGVASSTGSTDGTGSVARFNHPHGIAVDGSGNVYVTDNLNDTVRKITPAAGVTTLAGSALSAGSTDGIGNSARFNTPGGVAVNDIGGMVLAQTGGIYVTSGSIVSTVIAPSPFEQWGVLSYADDVSGSGTAVTVDVLDSNGNLLAAAVPSGTDLSTLPAVAAVSSIELRANLSTANTANTPIFESWSVTYFASVLSGWSSTISSTQTQPVPPVITSTAPPSGIVGAAYNFTFTATGTPAPTFSLTSGNLPPSLTLGTSGVLTGMPTAAGNYTGTVTASNGVGTAATQNFSITILSTYSSWAAQYFTPQQLSDPTVSGPNATPQNDGQINLLKYVYDIAPARTMTAADMAALPVGSMTTVAGQKYLCLTYRQNALLSGLTINLQSSPDLRNWITVVPGLSQQTGTDPVTGDPIVQVGVNVTNLSQEFLRLNVTSP